MLMIILSSIKRFLSISLFVPIIALGQTSLKGTIKDTATNATLIGVNVVVQGTSLGCATDIEGQYRIVGIPARVMTIKASCIGYEPKIIEIDFSDTNDVSMNIKLKSAILQGEEVVITGQMRGQIAAINQQITSNTIVNVVSEEKIKELPDANAAEAIGRLPGVSLIRSGGEATYVVLRGLDSKFSNITMDGVKIPATNPVTRDVNLSMISQGSLAGIELFKTLTPDQDADAIAGAINLVTKKAPSERLLQVDLKGDYNNLMKSANQYNISCQYGERYFNDVLGVQIQAHAEKIIRSKEAITYSYTLQDNYQDTLTLVLPPGTNPNDYYNSNFKVTFTDEVRKRNGGKIIFDLNTPDSGSVKLSGLYEGTTRNIMVYDRVYLAGGTSAWNYDYTYQEQGINTVHGALQGKNYLAGFNIDWGLSFAQSTTTNPYILMMNFSEQGGGSPPVWAHGNPEIYLIPYANNHFIAAVLNTAFFANVENLDKERTVHFDVTKNYTLGSLFADDAKVGGKYKERNRWWNGEEDDNSAYLYSFSQFSNNLDGTPINLIGTRFENFYLTRSNRAYPSLVDFIDTTAIASRNLLGLYKMTPLIDVNAMKLWYDLDKNAVGGSGQAFIPNVAESLFDYDVTERVSSAYVMNTLHIGQAATFILGIRVEKEFNDYKAPFTAQGLSSIGIAVIGGPLIDTTASYSETVWLPNLQFTVRPTDFLCLRLAAYRALARPDYNLRLPMFGIAPLNGKYLIAGNPNLRDAKAWNYETNIQIFDNSLGLFSISGFYKVIDDLFHQMDGINISWKNDLSNPNYYRLDSLLASVGSTWQNDPRFEALMHTSSSYAVTIAYNSPNPSYLWGFELEHQMNFSFLPVPWLKSITLSYNISITRSRTNIILNQNVVDSIYVPAATTGPPSQRHPARWQSYTQQGPVIITQQIEYQPELYGNLTLGYDISGFSARASLFYQDKYIQLYSNQGVTDTWVDPFAKLDLSFKQQITSRFSIILNINNVTNRQETTSVVNVKRDYWGSLPKTAQLYGRTIDFGVRVLL
jgi:TonB-dependent receptor